MRINHHEAALTLFQQLLLTGACVLPIAATCGRAALQRRRARQGKKGGK